PGRDRERGRIWRIVKAADGGAKQPSEFSKDEQASSDWRWTTAAKSEWSDADYALALQTIRNVGIDARIRRQAAEALAFRPRAGLLRPLSGVLFTTPNDDPALKHTLRIAVRNQLRRNGAFDEWRSLESASFNSEHAAEIERLMTSLDSPEAAE